MIEVVDVAVWRPIGGGVYQMVGAATYSSTEFEVRDRAEVGQLSLEIPAGQQSAAFQPGRLVTTSFRGDVQTWTPDPLETTYADDDTVRVTALDAKSMIGWEVAAPTPTATIPATSGILSGQGVQGNYSGPAAKVITDLVTQNLRRRLTFDSPPAEQLTWGANVPATPRFVNLLEEVQRIANRANLTVRFGLRLSDTDTLARLALWFEQPRDLSAARVELSPVDGSLESVTVVETPPSITHAIVGGKGEGAGQFLLLHTTPQSLADAAKWGARVGYIDGPETFDEQPLRDAAEDALIEGAARVTLTMEAAEPLSARAFEAFRPGDKFKVRLPGEDNTLVDASSAIRVADDGDGALVTVMFGDPDAPVGDQANAADAAFAAAIQKLRREQQALAINRKRGEV